MVQATRTSIFKWRFRWRCRRGCVKSLVIPRVRVGYETIDSPHVAPSICFSHTKVEWLFYQKQSSLPHSSSVSSRKAPRLQKEEERCVTRQNGCEASRGTKNNQDLLLFRTVSFRKKGPEESLFFLLSSLFYIILNLLEASKPWLCRFTKRAQVFIGVLSKTSGRYTWADF